MSDEATQKIDVQLIDPSPLNPNVLSDERYQLLVAGIRANGFLQPVLVRPRPGGRFQMADGHHRLRAVVELGHPTIEAVVREMTDDEYTALQLALNKIRGEIDLTRAATMAADLASRWSIPDLTITGYTEEEVRQLISMASEAHRPDVTPEGPPAEAASNQDAPEPTSWTLELVFGDRASYQLARKRLRKAAGPEGNLTVGLLNLMETAQ